MALYTERRVKKLVLRLKEEYDGLIRTQREEMRRLKEENRNLSARLLQLEGERAGVADALVFAAKESEKFAADRKAEAENENKELLLLAEKCRLLSEKLQEKYPDHEDILEFSRFTEELRRGLGEETGETSEFNMEDVIAPKQPLDLGKLCRELGLMEDDV